MNILFVILRLFFLITIIFWGFTSCNTKNGSQNKNINTDSIKPIVVDIYRFDQDLVKASNGVELVNLSIKDSVFLDIYLNNILPDIAGGQIFSKQQKAENVLKGFIKIPEFGGMLAKYKDSIFNNFEKEQADLNNLFTNYHYFFRKDTIPKIITFIAPLRFNFINVEGENTIGIGLDLYLGSNFKPYFSPQLSDNFPQWRIKKLDKKYLIPQLLNAYFEINHPLVSNKNRLIDEMIYQGKILYIMDLCLNNTEDSIKIGYHPEQMKWAIDNEKQIWEVMVQKKLLYITNALKIREYMEDGPFTTADGFGAGTSPKIGAYIGWKIVKHYMEKNKNITAQALIENQNYDDILMNSKYKP